MTRHLVAALSIALAPTLAFAQSSDQIICSEPVRPTCVGSDLTYRDQQRMDRCRRDLENFAQQVRAYMDCLDRKTRQQKERLEAVRGEFEERAAAAGGGDGTPE